tara:strand:+ start:134 stop:898 length:765 start_codon:yes stop_codon:yes gene_type:complete
MRRKIIAANWKMNLNYNDAIYLSRQIFNNLNSIDTPNIIISPPYIYLSELVELFSKIDNIKLAAQNCSKSKKGAFTGEISSQMLASINVDYVILGHSERRLGFNETNIDIKNKIDLCLENKLKVIFCCGESLELREKGLHFKLIETQIKESLLHLSKNNLQNIIIAYEPIWAIGTGMTATKDQAQEMHKFIRDIIKSEYGQDTSEQVSIIYGGSCKPSNSRELFLQKDIDGGLIGGASLNADDFFDIIKSIKCI